MNDEKKFNLSASQVRRFLDIYTAIKFSRNGNRRYVPVERGTEEKTQIKPLERLQAVAIGRDLERNSCKAITLIEQIKVLGFGHVKAEFDTGNAEWDREAKKEINKYFSRDCFYRCRMNLQEFAQLVESAKIREGDILIVFDFLTDSGKLLIWEADQLVTVDDGEWNDPEINSLYGWTDVNGKWHSLKQESGVVLDRFGKVIAYIVQNVNYSDKKSEVRGTVVAHMNDVTVIPAEHAMLYSRRFRLSQVRGVPSLLAISESLNDIDEMIKSELMGAKTASQWVAFIKQAADALNSEDQKTFYDMLKSLDTNSHPDGETPSFADLDAAETPAADFSPVAAAGAEADAESTLKKEPEKIRELEARSGGIFQELAPGEEPVVPNFNRPNLNTSAFYDHQGDEAGASLGLAQGYARMAVNSSYTSHRGETNLTYAHLKNRQKLAEWGWLDFIAIRRIEWAVKKGRLPTPPEDWELGLYWRFPEADFVQPASEIEAKIKEQKLGTMTLRSMLGPGWKEVIDQQAQEQNYAKEKGVSLAVFETAAGAPLTQNSGKPDNSKGNGDEH